MTNNKYDLVIFDLDGTLINSIEEIANSYRLACLEFGFPLPPTLEVTSWIGKGHAAAVAECFNWLERELQKDPKAFVCLEGKEFTTPSEVFGKEIKPLQPSFAQRHSVLYIEVGNSLSRLYPGVREVLIRLKVSGIKLAVLTNKMRALTPKVLKGMYIAEFFDGVFSDGDLQNNKPHPEGILKHMENFGVSDKRRVLMVGDSENDVNAGLAAGVDVLGLTYGYNYGKPIADSHPTYVSDHFSAVVALNESIALDSPQFKALVTELEGQRFD